MKRAYSILRMAGIMLLLAACEGGNFKSAAASDGQTESKVLSTDDLLPKEEPAEEPEIAPIPMPEETTPVPAPAADDGSIFKECNGRPDLPFISDLYQLAPDTKQLPDFSMIKPIKQICMKQLDIANRDFKEGFPGVEGLIEWFALSIRAKLEVPKDGNYIFSLNSDDGSKLHIDGELVINNDMLHSSKEVFGMKVLKAGTHDLKIEYFQGPRYHIALELFWQEPEATAKSYIPAAYLKRP